jgi:hypothetical protein
MGLIASPAREAEEIHPPVDEIKKEKARAGMRGDTAPAPQARRRSAAGRGFNYVLLGAALAAANHIRRRRGRHIAG